MGRRVRGLLERLRHLLPAAWIERHASQRVAERGTVDHVIILDGTMSSLSPGEETNAGLLYRLLQGQTPSARLSLYYASGIQMDSWRQARDVLAGRGINRQIRRAYGFLASRYRPGDRIFLFGYSRGAYAVRSLAGVIDRVGLVRAEAATTRNIVQAYRHYQRGAHSPAAAEFKRLFCHDRLMIDMVGAWDTVKALGFVVPGLGRFTARDHEFHNHALGRHIRRGYHALALDETRCAYAPVMWTTPENWEGELQQVWFRGTHGDVGGMLGGEQGARPLANISLLWMLERAEAAGLALPPDWRHRFPTDPEAPMISTWRGVGMLFVHRRRRVIGSDPSESIHPSAMEWYRTHHAPARAPEAEETPAAMQPAAAVTRQTGAQAGGAESAAVQNP